jgi:hypothetical protein
MKLTRQSGSPSALARGTPSRRQAPEANEDESKVPPYTPPDPLLLADGRR